MNTQDYQVLGTDKVDLGAFSTKAHKSVNKDEAREKLMPRNIAQIAQLQEKLYAQNRNSLLIVLQAMDAAGKDGIIRHVMTGLNPQGTQVVAFKVPSSEEMDHGYLWRINKALPRRGEIGIFNRSHYEDVLVARVHNLVSTSQLPKEFITDEVWAQRYRQIRNFETYLHENGTRVVKIFLHVSKEEQRKRLLDRINQPEKNWKFSSSDIEERRHWDDYQSAYEQMLQHTATQTAPWYVVPADNKWFSRYLVSQIVLAALMDINPQLPELPDAERAKLEDYRRVLTDES